jgi:hypothetical protein
LRDASAASFAFSVSEITPGGAVRAARSASLAARGPGGDFDGCSDFAGRFMGFKGCSTPAGSPGIGRFSLAAPAEYPPSANISNPLEPQA